MASYDGKKGSVVYKVYFKSTVTEPYKRGLQILRKYYYIPGFDTLGWENFDNKIVVSQSLKGIIKVIVRNEATLAIEIFKAFYNDTEVLKVSLGYSRDSLTILIEILRFLGVLKSDYKITPAANDFIDF